MGTIRRFFTGSKGTVRLELPPAVYSLGEEIEGVIRIYAKTDLGPGPLRVVLTCKERISRFRMQNGRPSTETRTKTVFRRQHEVKPSGILPAGQKMAVPFAMRLPFDENSPQANTPDWAWGVIAIMDALNPTQRSWWWELQVRYDVPNIALTDETRLAVHGFEEL